jgi:hypothetical protein
VLHRSILGASLLLVACGGHAGPATSSSPATSAEGAVRSFLQAVADSNLAKMAQYWGSAKGPAAKTGEPPDYDKRMVIMQAYLRSPAYRILPAPAGAQGDSREVQVELQREVCTRTVPFVVVKSADGSWIINQVDLAAAGSPIRPCPVKPAGDSTR